MKKWIFTSLIGLFGLPGIAAAQMDPGAFGYNNSDGSAWSGNDSTGRYVRKPKVKKTKRYVASDNPAATPTPTPVPGAESVSVTSGNRIDVKDVEPQSSPNPAQSPTPTPVPAAGSSIPNKVRDLVLGGDETDIQSYKNFLENQDIRKNIFEFSISTGYLYNASSSSYYFKNYNDSAPVAGLGVDIWLTPFLGVNADYKSTLLNELNDSPTQNVYVSTTQSWYDFGLRFRRFFGMSANASSFTLSLRYMNYQLNVPQSSLSRAKLQNQGPELDLDLTIPNGNKSFWTFGLLLQPYDFMTETSGSSVRAGGSNQTIGFGAQVGAEYRLSRQTCAFMKFSSTLYKSDFSGAASTVDPVTGSIPSNVPVTNIFYFLELGVRLGH